MKTYGIIAEYNPFHNGHLYHIEETKRRTGSDAIVAVMSGNFVQRGEPALTDKWTRAEAAVRCGVDLVLELPVIYACSSAEHFAFGGVGILDALGVTGGISFGVEADPPEALEGVAEILAEESPAFREALRRALDEGLSFASARARALEEIEGPEAAKQIARPNNILGVEYLKQIRRRKSGLRPLMIPRKGSGYDGADPGEGTAGAGWIRQRIRSGVEIAELADYYPDILRELYASADGPDPERLFLLTQYVLRFGGDPDRIDGVTEGLENRARKAALSSQSPEGLLDAVKSKRYSETAVRRMLTRILLGITKEDMEAFEKADRYAVRVLGFTEKGAMLLRQIRKREDSRVFLVTNVNRQRPEDPILQKMLEYDARAADLYDLSRNGRMGERAEYKMVPFRL